MLVVAANEGWKPQSEEHLAVLDLLGLDRGVVAVTKADRVDDDLLTLVTLEVEEKLAETSLRGVPLVATSVPDQAGIAELRRALARAVSSLPPPQLTDRARLWIDRSFTISGAGTVVTGTLTDGSLVVGDLVELLPGGIRARIRGIQSHEKERQRAEPRSRVAVNLAGIGRDAIQRGMVLAPPGQLVTGRTLLVRLRTVRSLAEPLTEKGAYHLHLGTGAWPVRMRLLDEPKLQGSGTALIESRTPIPAAVGDRLILREVGRRAVVAGGRVLDPDPPIRARSARSAVPIIEAALEQGRDRLATALLDVRGRAEIATLDAHSRGGNPEGALVADGWALSPASLVRLSAQAVAAAIDFQNHNPLRPGIPKASLASSLGIDFGIMQALIDATPELVDRGADVATADFSSTIGQAGEAAFGEVEMKLRSAGLAVPRIAELGIPLDLLHALVRLGRLVRISEDLVYLPEQLHELQERLAELPPEFTVAQFRDMSGTSRKYAVPLLEWFDDQRITHRRGDLRVVKPS